MIAKNVGIRRASGEFILATNIDVILNQKIYEFIEKVDIATYEFENIPFETLNEINKKKEISMDKFINSLGIRHVGENVSNLLCQRFDNIDIISNKAGPSSEPKTANRKGMTTFPKPYEFSDANDFILDSRTSELHVSSEVNISLH